MTRVNLDIKGYPTNTSQRSTSAGHGSANPAAIHPTWAALIRLCQDLGHGEIEKLKIQDGLPLSAEIVRRKIRLTD